MRIRIQPPADCDRGPRGVETMFDALHEANPQRKPMTLEIGVHDGEIALFAEMPSELKATFLEELQDAYPGVSVEIVSDVDGNERGNVSASVLLTPDIFSIRTFTEFDDFKDQNRHDPLSGVLSQFRPHSSVAARIRLTIRPATTRRMRRAISAEQQLQKVFLLDWIRRLHYARCTSPLWKDRSVAALCRTAARRRRKAPAIPTEKLKRHLFETQICVSVSGHDGAKGSSPNRLPEVIGGLGRFTSSVAWFRTLRICQHQTSRSLPTSLMNAEELATLWHIPVSTAEVAKLSRAGVRELEPPRCLPSKKIDGSDVTELGRVRFRGERRRFGISTDDLRRHLFICGRTGTGKSTLIRSMVGDAMRSEKSVCVIDPHGDLVEAILDDVPKPRTNDVVYFSAADRDCPVAFNPLHCPAVEQRPLVADNIVVSLKKLYGDSWGPRLEQILRNSVLALLGQPDATLLSIQRMLTSKPFRASVVSRISDPVIRSFWMDVFGSWNDRFREEAVSPVLNKLDAFLANPIARAITCQPQSTIHVRPIIDNPKSIFLCNLSKGLVGEQTSNLLGGFLVSAIQSAALSRADIPESDRNDVQVYIDEFHSFVSAGNSSFATILSESRKYRVSFAALATQFLEQIDEATLSAVLGNCGSTIVFRSGVRDSETLAEHLGGKVTTDDIVNLPNFTAYAKLLVAGEPTRSPFLMNTIPVESSVPGRREIVERVSRQKYGVLQVGLS